MKGKILFFLLLLVLLISLSPNYIYLVVVYGVLANMLLPKDKYWDNIAVLLLGFSVVYSLIQIVDGYIVSWANIISYIVCPSVFYRLGLYYTEKVQTKSDFIMLWAVMIFCYSLPLAMETINSIDTVGLVNRFRTMGSEGDEAKNATLYGLHASLGLFGISSLFSNQREITKQKIIFIFAFIVSLLTIIHLVNRTGLVIIMLSLISYLLYSGRISKRRLFWYLIVIAALVYFLINTNVISSDIIEAYKAREENAMGASSIEAGGRTDLWINSIDHLFTSPFGFRNERYSHNLWFDIARVSGLLAFIPFLIATILNYKCLIKIIAIGEEGITPLLIGLNIVMLLTSCVEPVIEASSLYFYLFMFLWGCNKEIYNEFYLEIED